MNKKLIQCRHITFLQRLETWKAEKYSYSSIAPTNENDALSFEIEILMNFVNKFLV